MSLSISNFISPTLMMGVLGSGMIHSALSSPTQVQFDRSKLTVSDKPNKPLASFFSIENVQKNRLEKRTPTTPPAYTIEQLSCGERLGVDPSECTAQGVYKNRNTAITNVLFDALEVSSWDDVSPNDLAGITVLNLKNRSLSTVLPNDLDGLTGVEYLDLSFNNLTEFTVPNYMTNIIELKLQNNYLTSISGINPLTNLEYLYLANNAFTSVTIPNTLTNLIYLSVSGNALTTFQIPESLTSLINIFATNNQLTSISLPTTLSNLQNLYLTNNQLSSFSLPPNWTNIEYLHLDRNQLSTITLPSTYTKLRRLFLKNNRLSQLTIPNTLTELNNVDLSHNQLTALSLTISAHSRLARLDISGSENNLTITSDILNYPFANGNAYLAINRNSQTLINEESYQWMDIRAVFGIIDMSGTVDTFQPTNEFQFPYPSDLTPNQISFLSNLLQLPDHAFPTPPQPTAQTFTSEQINCATRLNVPIGACNHQGVFVERNPIIKQALLQKVSANSWDDVTPNMLLGIKRLRLANSEIESISKKDLDGLTEMILLWLQGNQLSELPEGLLDELPKLKYFYAHKNNIASIPEGFFNHNPEIRKIYLQRNQLDSLPENTFSSFENLKTLRLHQNQLTHFPSDFLSDYSGLRFLSIYGNELYIASPVFRNLQNQQVIWPRYFTIAYNRATSNTNTTIRVETGNNSDINLADVVTFFRTEIHRRNNIFYPRVTFYPTSLDGLTNEQIAFVCLYLNPSSNLDC